MLVTLLVKFRNKDCKTTELGLLLQVLPVRIVTFVETLGSHLKPSLCLISFFDVVYSYVERRFCSIAIFRPLSSELFIKLNRTSFLVQFVFIHPWFHWTDITRVFACSCLCLSLRVLEILNGFTSRYIFFQLSVSPAKASVFFSSPHAKVGSIAEPQCVQH